MNVFIQGLRRSGTTFLFDIFLEDDRFACHYEPFARALASVGGGSGVHDADLFESVRAKRASFLDRYPEWSSRCPDFSALNFLNYGAPRLPELEFDGWVTELRLDNVYDGQDSPVVPSRGLRVVGWGRYVFDAPEGKTTLLDLFDGRSQLIVYHFMFDPRWSQGCKFCSFVADHLAAAYPDGWISGTVVLIEKLDRLEWTTAQGLRENLCRQFGVTYHKLRGQAARRR